MDKEEEKAASEEQDHIPPEKERSSSEECLPEAEETEEGIVFALLECVEVFSGGFVSIFICFRNQACHQKYPVDHVQELYSGERTTAN